MAQCSPMPMYMSMSQPILNCIIRFLQHNWDRIDYIVADSEVLSYIKGISATSTDPAHILRQAFDHSILRAEFKTADHTDQFAIDIYEVQHKLASSNSGNSIK